MDSYPELDFTFAYDVKDYSDRRLRIEIWDGVLDTNSEKEICVNLSSQWKKKKMKTEDTSEKGYVVDEQDTNVDDEEQEEAMETSKKIPYLRLNIGGLDAHTNSKEQIVHWKMPKKTTNFFVGYADEEQEEAMETSDEDSFESNYSNLDSDESNSNVTDIVRMKIIHINSIILAKKSVFFDELFKTETRGSEHRNVTIRIHVSEEVALLDLLSFMYSNTLSTRSLYGLMRVMMVADKYKVSSCMKYCSKLVQSFEMTPSSAVSYLNLPFTVLMVEAVQPLVDAAKVYLTRHFNSFDKVLEMMSLPLLGIEVVLSNNDLQIPSEDIIYEFLINWVALHYSEPDERRRIMNTRLSRLMRFHYMSCKTLKDVMTCPNLDSSVSSKIVLEALFFQAEPSHNQRALTDSGDFSVKRAYRQFPFRTMELQLPSPPCTVYVELKMEECICLSTTRDGFFRGFYLDGEWFYLNMRYNMDPRTGYQCFGLLLEMQSKCVRSTPIRVYYKFSVMQKPQEFILKYEGNYTFEGGTTVGCRDLFAMPWTDLMAEDCVYIINGSLHLMVEVMVTK